MGAHARTNSPSGSRRWLACPGSERMIRQATEQGLVDAPGPWAAEGSALHSGAERQVWHLITGEGDAVALGDDLGEGYLADAERLEAIQYYATYITRLLGGKTPTLFGVETQVDLSRYLPDWFGTADFWWLDTDTSTLHVVDAKFGRKPVDAENNPQLMIYALGLLDELDLYAEVKNVQLHIVQPRLAGADEEEVSDGR